MIAESSSGALYGSCKVHAKVPVLFAETIKPRDYLG